MSLSNTMMMARLANPYDISKFTLVLLKPTSLSDFIDLTLFWLWVDVILKKRFRISQPYISLFCRLLCKEGTLHRRSRVPMNKVKLPCFQPYHRWAQLTTELCRQCVTLVISH